MFFGKKKDASEAWKAQGKGSELRDYPRMNLKTLVTARARGNEAHCKLNDLSLGGCAFVAPWQLDSNDHVSITLEPPQGVIRAKQLTPVFIDARVCRVGPSAKHPGQFQTGVRFVNPSKETLEVVKAWFESFGEAPEKGTERRAR